MAPLTGTECVCANGMGWLVGARTGVMCTGVYVCVCGRGGVWRAYLAKFRGFYGTEWPYRSHRHPMNERVQGHTHVTISMLHRSLRTLPSHARPAAPAPLPERWSRSSAFVDRRWACRVVAFTCTVESAPPSPAHRYREASCSVSPTCADIIVSDTRRRRRSAVWPGPLPQSPTWSTVAPRVTAPAATRCNLRAGIGRSGAGEVVRKECRRTMKTSTGRPRTENREHPTPRTGQRTTAGVARGSHTHRRPGWPRWANRPHEALVSGRVRCDVRPSSSSSSWRGEHTPTRCTRTKRGWCSGKVFRSRAPPPRGVSYDLTRSVGAQSIAPLEKRATNILRAPRAWTVLQPWGPGPVHRATSMAWACTSTSTR